MILYVVFLSAKVIEKIADRLIFGRYISLLFELFTLYNDFVVFCGGISYLKFNICPLASISS